MLQDIGRAEITQDWDAVIKKYGTHYVSEVRVGGLVEAMYLNDARCSSVCARKKSSKPIASVLDSMRYLAGFTTPRDFEDNLIAPDASVYSVGGDPDFGVGCLNLIGCTPYNIRSWQSQVFAQSAPYAVVLTPISLLFSNGIGRMNRCLAIDTALGMPPSFPHPDRTHPLLSSLFSLTPFQARLPTSACSTLCLKIKTTRMVKFYRLKPSVR